MGIDALGGGVSVADTGGSPFSEGRYRREHQFIEHFPPKSTPKLASVFTPRLRPRQEFGAEFPQSLNFRKSRKGRLSLYEGIETSDLVDTPVHRGVQFRVEQLSHTNYRLSVHVEDLFGWMPDDLSVLGVTLNRDIPATSLQGGFLTRDDAVARANDVAHLMQNGVHVVDAIDQAFQFYLDRALGQPQV